MVRVKDQMKEDSNMNNAFQEPEIEIKMELEYDAPSDENNTADVEVPKTRKLVTRRRKKNITFLMDKFGSRSRSERTKRAKSIYDPSIDRKKKRKRLHPLTSLLSKRQQPIAIKSKPNIRPPLSKSPNKFPLNKRCYVCLNSEGYLDQTCSNCNTLAHNKCLQHQQNSYVVRILGPEWKCPACLLCFFCQENSNNGQLVICTICKNAYHPTCHLPRLKSVNNPESWICSACIVMQNDWGFRTDAIPVCEVKCEPDTPFVNQRLVAIEKLKSWNTEDVYEYFHKYFPDIASVFREQEIDGSSILLMSRVDVLKGFKHLKLGTALHIYQHVVKLQNGGNDDPRLSWH